MAPDDETMTPDRWRRISEIFHGALAREATERAVFLSEVCADDDVLHREVALLLENERSAERFMAAPALDLAAAGISERRGGVLVGQQVGACRILSLLGAGGMGEVYRARDTRLGRDVAVKVLPHAFTSEPERVDRFKREARLLAALNHPHIAAIYSLEEFEGVPALVLELVEGPTLAERLAAGRLEIREALEIARQLIDALDAAHARGIIHRDLKPANIKFTPGNMLKVLDFGLAMAQAPTATTPALSHLPTITTTLADAGRIVGTPAYMSPEQARGASIDSRTDIWSFGCLLYEIVTGSRPFGGETLFDTIAAILEREPDWNRLPETTPAGVRRLLRRCLAKDARHRLDKISDALFEIDDAPAGPPAPASPPRAIRALAVLPFANASGDADMEYLSDGLTETIIRSLSQLSGLRVMARSTVFRYKGRHEDTQEIGRALCVGAVVTGRVLQRGDTLVVDAELVDVENGWQLWGARYTKNGADIFATEQAIATQISANLQLNLTPHSERLLTKRYTDNVAAYHLYLKGKYCWGKRTREALTQAVQYFRQAIDLDPTYALAYAGLAAAYAPMVFYGHVHPSEGMLNGKAAARKALEIDPMLSEARTMLGGVLWSYDRDYAGAERELRAVIEADPNYPWARQLLAELLTSKGQFAEAGEETRRALEIDPLSLPLHAYDALERFYARRYDEAVALCRRTIEMEAKFYLAHSILGMAYEQLGQFTEAIAALRQAQVLSDDSPYIVATLAGVYATSGHEAHARNILRALEQAAPGDYVSAVLQAVILTGLGETERALACLEQAFEERDAQLIFLKVDPRLDRLRGESRFQDLMLKLGMA